MRPRTKLQVDVIYWSQRTHLISLDKKQWAFDHVLEHKGFQTKKKVTCMDCGDNFSPSLVVRKKATCPHCNTKLNVEISKKRTDIQRDYFAVAEICGEYQIIRNFQIHGRYKANERKYVWIREVLQHWIIPNGKREVVALSHNLSYCCDSWSGDMEIREKSNTRRYDVYPSMYHPESEFFNCYTKYGINYKLEGLTFLEAIEIIPQSPRLETLLKAKQFRLLGFSRHSRWQIDTYWRSIRICIRNKHIVKQPQLWIDYLQLLSFLGKDLHSPKYLFPKNLKIEHDRLVNKRRQIQQKEAEQRKRLKAAADDIEYKKAKQSFFGIVFSNGKITIKVIESVHQFMEIGDKLKHCVYANEYYKKDDSLILSAEINNEPIETIELDLKSMEIIQARGLQNKASKYNSKIIDLVNKNLPLIKNVAS
jgi:DNA-directed RNA polymerase subunit RPC12/RpoP